MKLSERIAGIWYGGTGGGPLPLLLGPAAILYRGLLALREFAYRSGLRKTRKLPVPLVSVGNLVVGGSGKTPTVAWLAERYGEWGRQPAVVSRGYGGSRRGPERVPSGREPGAARLFGDEPVMIARSRPGLPVVIGRDRWEAGMEAVRSAGAEVVIADDAFQHRRLARDLDLVVVDAGRLFGNGRLFPSGPLREPPEALGRADAVLLTRVSSAGDTLEACRKELRRLAPRALHAEAEITASRWRRFDGVAMEGPPGEGLFAFCGIAHGEAFRSTLEESEVSLRGWETFPDHHAYETRELQEMVRRAVDFGAAAVTTEKDAARIERWPGAVPLYILEVRLEIVGGGEALEERLRDLCT